LIWINLWSSSITNQFLSPHKGPGRKKKGGHKSAALSQLSRQSIYWLTAAAASLAVFYFVVGEADFAAVQTCLLKVERSIF
jgi:hypothetical protein